MGVSTDAILFYGFCWDEEQEWAADFNDVEWTERVALKRGNIDPWERYPKEIEELPYAEKQAAGDKWCDENRAALDAWSDLKESIEAEFGCEILSHCSDDCPVPYIAVKASALQASRGYPERLDEWPAIGADWDEKLKLFCKEVGIKPPKRQKPGWWLVSYWG